MPFVTKERGAKGRDNTLARQEEERTPRPGTRQVWISSKYAPEGDVRVRVTLPAEPWHGGDAK